MDRLLAVVKGVVGVLARRGWFAVFFICPSALSLLTHPFSPFYAAKKAIYFGICILPKNVSKPLTSTILSGTFILLINMHI
ncbi:hypothetical protein GGTG_04267 [Gaeumannomyces tritici R3-111a-1]|uniref:Uncharacterized protein n=1 Tax=Gaeumannomyces tritici (strain R3-111a-1) TaxID=644352 RepID=J3NSL6_GAET3|nr:hypothetical protein GGTG_04267 [Gaeumannomyces tritici R3-111a-1]EJT79179.1 hypothetical protein GGTG_04267 [Gaeumannomyces tritici R3-111a-1]